MVKQKKILVLSGLIMAAAVEHVDLHKRIALNVMRLVGTSPRMLILSFMLPTGDKSGTKRALDGH